MKFITKFNADDTNDICRKQEEILCIWKYFQMIWLSLWKCQWSRRKVKGLLMRKSTRVVHRSEYKRASTIKRRKLFSFSTTFISIYPHVPLKKIFHLLSVQIALWVRDTELHYTFYSFFHNIKQIWKKKFIYNVCILKVDHSYFARFDFLQKGF